MPDGASGRITLGSMELMLGGQRRIHLPGPALKRGNRWHLPLDAWRHFTRDKVEWRPKDNTLVIQSRRETAEAEEQGGPLTEQVLCRNGVCNSNGARLFWFDQVP